MTWLYGQTVFDAAMAAMDGGRNLAFDLGSCEYMDSTLLGTLHELTVRAEEAGRELWLQNVSEDLRNSFQELHMLVVLRHLREQPIEWSQPITSIDLRATHEMLAELSDENREQFGSLVQTLRTELGDQ